MERAGNPGSNPGGRTKLEDGQRSPGLFCQNPFSDNPLFTRSRGKTTVESIMMRVSRKDEKTTVRELVERVVRFRDSRDWRKYDTPRNLAGSICIEAAELLEHFQWKTDDQVTEMLRNPEQLKEISHELADVLTYCLDFSDILGIDVSDAIQKKLRKNAEKYPAQRRK